MLKNKNIIITGGCGFIGSNLAEKLSENNNVTIVDNLSSGKKENIEDFEKKVRFLNFDVRNKRIEKYFIDVDVVFHEAANVFIERSIHEPIYDSDVNILGTINVLEVCRKRDVKKFVFASSSAVYGNPISLPIKESHPTNPDSPYAVSKLSGEYFCRLYHALYGIETVMLRYFNVYGKRQDPSNPYSGVIAIFMANAIAGRPLTIYGDGEQTRDFVYIDDVVEANLLAAESRKGVGRVFNIGTGTSVSIKELAKTMRRFGKNIEIKYSQPRLGDIRESTADVSRAKKILEFEARTSLNEGLKRYYEWFVVDEE